jgi:hypothetical protein
MTMRTLEQAIDDIAMRVVNGELTQDEGTQLARELAVTSATGRVPDDVAPKPPKPDPRKAPAIEKTDIQLLVDALVAEGVDERIALRTAVNTDPATQAEVIKAERARQQAIADKRAEAAFAASPAGRLEEGNRLAAERAELDKLVRPAEELLRSVHGLTDSDLASLSSEEKAVLAGLREAPAPQRRESGSRMIAEDASFTASQIGRELAADAAAEGGQS